ncbi:MAG TPA: nodulation protein NfeD [Dongiaceae bacterium]|nr:nodulation protein NfeD [Dongiaceae bacterium]
MKEAVERARDGQAELLIIRLDTPGGLVSSMETMVETITHAPFPVVVFVHGAKAASAGFFLTIAADIAVMAPGTRIGAAHPVLEVGEVSEDSVMAEKMENDLAAYVRTIAENRHRNVDAAEKAVRDSVSYTEQEALKLGLIDFIARDEDEILARLDGKPIRRFQGESVTLALQHARITSLDKPGLDRFLSLLANPALAVFLLFAGLLGIYVEATHPGVIAPGVVGVACLLLFLLSTPYLPVNWFGVGLVVLGIVMFVLELKVVSHGALTAGGILCLVTGGMLIFPIGSNLPGARLARAFIFSVAATAAVAMAILTWLIRRSGALKKVSGADGLLLEQGTAITDLDLQGKVFIHGEYWNARARRAVPRGARVRVAAVDGLTLEVEEVST